MICQDGQGRRDGLARTAICDYAPDRTALLAAAAPPDSAEVRAAVLGVVGRRDRGPAERFEAIVETLVGTFSRGTRLLLVMRTARAALSPNRRLKPSDRFAAMWKSTWCGCLRMASPRDSAGYAASGGFDDFIKYRRWVNRQQVHALLVEQMIDLASSVMGVTKDVVDSCGLTESEARLLWLAGSAVEPLSLKQLAARMRFDPSNVTLLSDKLDEKGLARRKPHPSDGRVRTLVLTAAGRRMRDRLVDGAYTRSPFGALDFREQRQLSQLLAKALRRPS